MGPRGENGRDGKMGLSGLNGRDGRDGKPGKDCAPKNWKECAFRKVVTKDVGVIKVGTFS